MNRMPSGIGLSHKQIWKNFLEAYGQYYQERELRQIHEKWTAAAAYAGFVRKHDVSRKDAAPSRRSGEA